MNESTLRKQKSIHLLELHFLVTTEIYVAFVFRDVCWPIASRAVYSLLAYDKFIFYIQEMLIS